MKSLNEIQSLVRKACIGAGHEVGCADDASNAAVWLTRNGLDGIAAILGGIGTTKIDQKIETNSECVFETPSMIADGPAAIDLVLAHNLEVKLLNMDSPLLLLGLAGAAAREFGSMFKIAFSDTSVVLISSNGITRRNEGFGPNAVVSKIADEANTSETQVGSLGKAYEVSLDAWRKLETYAAKTYVPSSEASRLSGAGAGLNDND